MDKEEQKIAKAAQRYCKECLPEIETNVEGIMYQIGIIKALSSGFIAGSKSDAAKEYHTKGMYSREEVIQLCKSAWFDGSQLKDIGELTFDNWLKENLK